MGRAFHGDDGVYPRANGAADNIIHVSPFQQVIGVLVVGAEHAVGVIFRREERQKRVQIPGGGSLPNHDILSAAQLRYGVLDPETLVVGVDPGGNVGVERVAGQFRGVAVNLLVVALGGHNLFEYLCVRADDAGEVHHLRETLHAVVGVKGINGAEVQRRPRLVQRRGGYTAREHDPHIHGQSLRGL